MCAKAPEAPQSVYAAEGTKAHEIAERLLRSGKVDSNDEELIESVNLYREILILSMVQTESPNSLQVESKVNIPLLSELAFGTCDAWFNTSNELYVFDFKYGKGVREEATNNYQMMYYALGVIQTHHLMGIDKIIMTIVQPRMDNVSTAEISYGQLYHFYEKALAALRDGKTLKVGEHCRWCSAKAFCPEQLKTIEEIFGVKLNMLNNVKSPSQLSEAEILKYLDNAELLYAWVRAVKNYAQSYIESGGELPGYTLESSLGNREWVDDSKVESLYKAKLGEKIYSTPKLKSVAQLEKVVKKELGDAALHELANYTTRKEGEKKLVKVKTNTGNDIGYFEDVV